MVCVKAWTNLRLNLLERSLSGLDGLGRGERQHLPAHLLTGMDGEDAAYFYLRRERFVIVARRWSCGEHAGDVDLIGWDSPMLCFIEVKTRTAKDMTPAEAAVHGHKRHVLRKLARQYLRQLPGDAMPPVRFDVISVYLVPGEPREFVHYKAAFGWDEHSLQS